MQPVCKISTGKGEASYSKEICQGKCSEKRIQVIYFLGKNADWESWAKEFFHMENIRVIKNY